MDAKSVAAETVTIEEIETEITRIIEAEMVETTVTGSVRSAITRTSLSEPNAIAVASQKVEAAEITEEAEMTAETEAGMIAEVAMTEEAEMIEGVEMIEVLAKAPIHIMTGLVANVKTPTSRLELNATVVALPREEVEVLASNGQATNVELVIEEMHHSLGQGIGNAHNVENPISPGGMIALAVGAQRELAVLSKEGIIAN